MFVSFLKKLRGCVSIIVVLAFFHGQMSWSMSGAARLIPGAPLTPAQQQPTPPPPGEVQQPTQPAPQPPLSEGQTTVVQVPVPKENTLDISVVDGEGATNIVGKKNSTRASVQVRDEKNELLEGAVVTFIAPADGPSVVFSNGLRTVTVMTDSSGRARTPSFRAVNSGPFRLQVSASFRGQTVSTSISQDNYDNAAQASGKSTSSSGDNSRPIANKKSGGGGLSGTTWAILLGVGAAAAVGIGVGLGGHKGSTSTSTTTATISGPGSPTVGAP